MSNSPAPIPDTIEIEVNVVGNSMTVVPATPRVMAGGTVWWHIHKDTPNGSTGTAQVVFQDPTSIQILGPFATKDGWDICGRNPKPGTLSHVVIVWKEDDSQPISIMTALIVDEPPEP